MKILSSERYKEYKELIKEKIILKLIIPNKTIIPSDKLLKEIKNCKRTSIPDIQLITEKEEDSFRKNMFFINVAMYPTKTKIIEGEIGAMPSEEEIKAYMKNGSAKDYNYTFYANTRKPKRRIIVVKK